MFLFDLLFGKLFRNSIRSIDPLTATAIGIGALTGGAFLFGKSKKKKQQAPQAQPVRETRLTDFPSGQLTLKTLQERLAGRGVGFRPEVIRGATAPFAAQQRAGLRQQVLPTISAQASARGLGRSTIPVGQAGQAAAGVERDIASRVAELSLANEQQRRSEINQALAQLQQFAGSQAGFKQAGTGLQVQAGQFAQGLGFQQQQADFQNQLALAQLGLSAGTLGAKIGGVGGFAPSPLFGTTGAVPGATVNIAGTDVNQEEFQLLKQLLNQ